MRALPYHAEKRCMSSEAIVRIMVILFDGGFFYSSIHSFNLTICPGMTYLGASVLDVAFAACSVKDVHKL